MKNSNVLSGSPSARRIWRDRCARATWQRGAGAIIALVLTACGSQDTLSGGTDSDHGGGGGTEEAASISQVMAAPTVAVLANLTFAGYKIDFYLPSNAERVIVFLHGGGGSKEGAASTESGIRLDDPPQPTPVPNTQWLTARRTAFVFPQGKALTTSPAATTWNNYVMTSGVDDLAFLGALAGSLRNGGFNAGVPSFSRVYLAGHSNGGMMTNRVWCEASSAFDGYGALAGPASTQLAPPGLMLNSSDPRVGQHACAPTTPKPYIGILGEQDTILQPKGAWAQNTWAINSCLSQGNGGAMVDPNLINEQRFHEFRISSLCGGTSSAPKLSADGSTTTWSGCGGQVRLVGVIRADHCVSAGQVACLGNKLLGGDCANSLEAESGAAMRDMLVNFFTSTEG